MIPRGALLVAVALWSPIAVAAERPRITSAAVADDEITSVVKLGASSDASNVLADIDCSTKEPIIRIRFDGLGARVKNDVEELALSEMSPFRAIRIVPRSGPGTVLQLVPRSSVASACNRVTVSVAKNEVQVSYQLNQADKDRRARPVIGRNSSEKAVSSRDSLAQSLGDPQKAIEPTGKPAPKAEAQTQAETATAPVAGALLFAKDKEQGQKKTNSAKAASTQLTSGSGPSPLLAAVGCALAGLIALAAFLVRRHGKRVAVSLDSIEILSSKRLGARQSLVLAAVGGKRFLLAVSDKNVSTLGEVPDEGAEDDDLVMEVGPRRKTASTARAPQQPAHEAPTMPRENLDDLKERDPRDLLKQLLSSNAAPEPVFERELRAALGTPAQQSEPAHTSRNLNEPSVDGVSSNAAGLIAMARMRASMRRPPHGPAAQA